MIKQIKQNLSSNTAHEKKLEGKLQYEADNHTNEITGIKMSEQKMK